MRKKYKLCVYAICKNEEKFVDRWMDSMKEADLIVVTDTGSTDGTVEKLRERGAVVYIDEVKPWRFDAARNISLDHVPEDADICVCTDLDEIFTSGWRKCIEKVWKQGVNRGRYLYNWSLKEDGTPDVQFNYFKIHDRKNFKWVQPVHEYVSYIGETPEQDVFIEGMVLSHYPDSTKSRGSYLPLLKLAVEESPENDRANYYLGREYMYGGEWQKCIDTLKKYLNLKSATWNEERCAAMRWIAAACHRQGDNIEAYKWYYRAVAEAPLMREPYIECAKMAYELSDWDKAFYMVEEALKINEKSSTFVNMGYAWDYTADDLGAISCYRLGMYERSLAHAKAAVELNPKDERLQKNLILIEEKNVKFIHTLLFLLRENYLDQDKELVTNCLKSLEKGTYKTVVIFNQGCLTNKELESFLSAFDLNCIVIGEASNVGTASGRQSCFEYIWKNYPNTKYISEIHPDMVFTFNWEDPCVDYLDKNNEPMISCGIVDSKGNLAFLNTNAGKLPSDNLLQDDFLKGLRQDKIVHGFTNPCIHNSTILKAAGGYNRQFLAGKQCFEDDSMLLGYYYYYGTQADWYPKINYNSVVYHAVAGQRFGVNDNTLINYNGLVKQYGAMGIKHLSRLHKSQWHKDYFSQQYNSML